MARGQAPQPRSGAPQGAGLDGEPRGRGTIGRADRCNAITAPFTHLHHTAKRKAIQQAPIITHRFSRGTFSLKRHPYSVSFQIGSKGILSHWGQLNSLPITDENAYCFEEALCWVVLQHITGNIFLISSPSIFLSVRRG